MNEHEIYDYDDTLVITNTRRKQLEEEALAHHGILGMKWGVRRYQNEDGSLTELGQRHYDMLERKQELEYDRRNRKEEADVERQRLKYQRASEKQGLYNQRDRDVYDFANQERERKLHRRNVLTAVAVGALAVGGGIALHNYLKNKGNTPINAPELTTTISTGKDNVQRLLFNTNGINNGTANYNFGGSGKNASTFGQTKIDDLKKLMDSSSKAKTLSKGKIKIENLAKKGNWGVAADNKQDVLEKLDSFTSPWDNARKSMANKRAVSISQTIAENNRRNSLNKAIDDTVNRIGSGNVGKSNLIFNKPKSVIPQPSWSTPSWNDPIAKAATSMITKPATSSKSSPVSGASLAQKGADLLAKKAEFDRRSGKVDDAFDRLDKMSKKFKHSNIGDAYDMTDSKLMHTAMAISSRRRAQLESRDDYLMHYGRKGMKWGEDIFAEDEVNKRQSRSVDPNQYAQQLLAEANRRKQNHQNTSLPGYGDGTPLTQNTSNPGYGDGTPLTQNTSLPGYGDGVLLNTEKKSTTKVEPRQKHDPTINVRGKQVSTEDIDNQKNKSNVEELAKNTAQAIDNVNNGNTGNGTVDALINAKNNRYKMLYDMVVPTKETNKTENRRLDTANESNSSPDKLKKKLMHTAMAISNRRRTQLETRDDYLMHYGRKGMKWGEDIYAQDEVNKRQSGGQSQYAQQLKAEAYKRKYGNSSGTTNDDTARANGAAIRARQKAIREAQAKYGGGSNSNYANQQMAKQAEESRRAAQNKAASEKYGNKYGNVGQGSSYVNGQISNQQKKTAENIEYANNITHTTDRYVDDYFSRNQNAKLYKSLSVDAANDSADMIGSPTLNGVMSGKRKKLSKEDDTREKLFNSMKEQVRKNVHDDIDAHADGLTPAQLAKAHGEADIAIDKNFNEKAHKYDPMMLWETNADVHEKVEKSLQETGRNYAMSTGGVQDISQRKPIVEVDENDIDTSPAYGDKRTNKPTPVEETPKSTQVGETPKPKNPSAKDMAKRFKQENIAQEGLKDSRSVVTGQVEISAEDIYDVGERGNIKEITEMQDALKEQYDHLTALRDKPRFAKYEKEIQQELDILDGNMKWLESTK